MAGLRPEQLRGGTSGNIFVDDGTRMKSKTLSGDATLASSGAITLATVNSSPGSFGSAASTLTATVNGKGLITALAAISIAIAASQITSGQLALARGGTNADLSATGGANQFVKQSSSGAAFTVGTIGTSDIPSLSSQGMSVALSMPAIFSVSGSPITSSGTLSVSLANQSANLVFASPDNASGTPSFRALVARDWAASPLQGTIAYASSATGLAWLATGTANQILTTQGASANPSYQNIASLLTAGTGITKSGTTNATIALTTPIVQPMASLVTTLTDAATIATDASLGNHFRVTLGGNRTLGQPTNPTDGQKIIYEIIQDGTGSRTLAYNSVFAFGTDVASPTLTTTANKRDFIGFVYNSTATKWYCLAVSKGY